MGRIVARFHIELDHGGTHTIDHIYDRAGIRVEQQLVLRGDRSVSSGIGGYIEHSGTLR